MINLEKFTPSDNYVLLTNIRKVMPYDPKYAHLMPEQDRHMYALEGFWYTGEVTKRGKNVDFVEDGERVLFSGYISYFDDEEKYAVVKKDGLVAVVEDL